MELLLETAQQHLMDIHAVAAGIHTITATAVDAAGNVATQSIQVTVNTTVLPPSPLPSKVSLAMPPVGHQGSEGSCVAWAIAYYARSAEAYYRSNATSYNLSTNIFSPEFLYNQTRSGLDCSSGSSVLTALDFLVGNGVCTWQSMPYTSGNCSLLPSSQQSMEAASYKINSYSIVLINDITAIKTLLSQNHPLLLGISTDQQFDNAGPGFVWSSYGSAISSLHEVTICGYDDARQAFKIVNSWGTGWGDAGYSWISYDFLPRLNNYVFALN
jgi:C1A family cysteine protease